MFLPLNKHVNNPLKTFKKATLSHYHVTSMRGTEIEVPDQSDAILASIVKEKKSDVQKIIDDLPFCSSKYSLIRVPFRKFMLSDMLRFKDQTSLSIFQLFIFSNLLQIIAKHINLKASLKRDEECCKQRS